MDLNGDLVQFSMFEKKKKSISTHREPAALC